MADKISILRSHPSLFNYQQCTLNHALIEDLESKNDGKFSTEFLSIKNASRRCKYLVRGCKYDVTDVVGVVQSDLRVVELDLDIKEEKDGKDKDLCRDSDGDGASEKVTFSSSESQSPTTQNDESGIKSKLRQSWSLSRHLMSLMMNGRESSAGAGENSVFDVDEDALLSTVRFNDAVWCTSKDIQMLKSGTIKMMRLTVISDSSLSDFLYHTNQERRSMEVVDDNHEHHHGEEFFSKNASMNEEQTSFNSKRNYDNVTSSEGKESRISSSWKLLQEKVRQIFQSYDIHVRSQTLVDLRGCPLASKGNVGCPSISFVFVEETAMRNSSGTLTTESDMDIGKVASKTEILINHVRHISYYRREVSFESTTQRQLLYGVENAATLLTSLIEMQTTRSTTTKEIRIPDINAKHFPLMDNFLSHGLLIAGPSGCGKSLVVRETVKKLRANLLVFGGSPLGDGNNGGSGNNNNKNELTLVGESWTDIFERAVKSAQMYVTVLLIPRVDEKLLIKSNGNKNTVKKLVDHVCTLMDDIPRKCRLTVVATTDKPYIIPPKLRRTGRFEREVYIGAPTEEERLNILQSLCEKTPSLSKLDLASVAMKTPGYVGQDLIRLTHLAILKSYEENCSQVADVHIKYALSRILPSVLQGTLGVVGIQRATSLDHIAGLHSVKHDLIKAIVWPLKFPHAFQTMGIKPPKGILLHSPPGCAKTTLVRAVAASHQTNFLSVSAAELFSSGLGDSEKIVADLFHRARMASPCILFIDELEAIVGSRQMSQKREKTTNESILSMLLTEMDGIGTQAPVVIDRTVGDDSKSLGPLVLVVAATNRIDMIDSALIRPGRFDKLIYVPPLNEEGREELLKICGKSIPFDDNVDFTKLAKETQNYTGADVVNLCREAALLALTENMDCSSVSLEHFLTAKSNLSPSLSNM